MVMVQNKKPVPRGRTAIKFGAAVLATGLIAWGSAAMSALPSEGYSELVEKVSPSVVFISSTRNSESSVNGADGADGNYRKPAPGGTFEEFLKRFQKGNVLPKRPTTALGSGFIISPEGEIVTNNHVIEGASKVEIKLPDGRKFVAKVVGSDPKTDLALLKIKTEKPLPFVIFGDSARVRAGDIVLAVGNPFGLGGTVTAGIVSARNRDINAGPYDDFIQTDATINRGNSGGPLFNTAGQVVGVNTAIISPTGGSVGIGFAIPANAVKDVVSQLKERGNVERGWLGVAVQPVTPEIADALGIKSSAGALISEVSANSPSAKAGLKQGDVIVEYDGKPVRSTRDLPRFVAATHPGETVDVMVKRGAKTNVMSVKVGRLDQNTAAAGPAQPKSQRYSLSKSLGVELAPLDARARAQLGLPKTVEGVVIAEVDEQGRGAAAGLAPGDVIQKVGSKAISNPPEVDKALKGVKGKAALLLVNRGGRELFIAVKLADA